MQSLRCENHPDREATTTLAVRVMPLGRRPILVNMGFDLPGKFYDLCNECYEGLTFIHPKKEETNASA